MEYNRKVITNLIIYVFIFIAISAIILNRNLNDLDEVWNFNFAKNIANGLIPYRDFNMVITPLNSLICGLFLKIFGNQLIVMRILAIFLSTSILFIIYKIMELIKINKLINYISILFVFLILYNHFRLDYNFSILFITLIIIYLEIKEYKKDNILLKHNFKNDIILGFLSGICIALKQTTGLIIVIGLISYKIFEIKNSLDFKEFIRIFISRLLGAIIIVFMLIMYVFLNGILDDFVDYCILGLKTFTNYIPYYGLISSNNFLIKILSILVPLILITMFILALVKKDKIILIILVYSIMEFAVVFPISDIIHFCIGSIPTIIGFVYIVNNLLNISETKQTKIFSNIVYIVITSILIQSMKLNYNYMLKAKSYSELDHFYYIPITKSLCQSIKVIDRYILEQQKQVYILDYKAAIYMIPIDRYNKNYDMFLKGNLGSKGEEGQIEILKNEDAIILIKSDNYIRNWQNPELVRQYIKKNINKIGEIESFEIYSTSSQ